jgi:hypothetical protein
MDPIRRNILTTGAAAAATAAAPQVFAQQVDQGGAFKFYEKARSAFATRRSAPAFRCWSLRAYVLAASGGSIRGIGDRQSSLDQSRLRLPGAWRGRQAPNRPQSSCWRRRCVFAREGWWGAAQAQTHERPPQERRGPFVSWAGGRSRNEEQPPSSPPTRFPLATDTRLPDPHQRCGQHPQQPHLRPAARSPRGADEGIA